MDGDADGLKTWRMLIAPLTEKKAVRSNFVPGQARVLSMKSALDAANRLASQSVVNDGLSF
jgi:hypothetical protein